MDGNIRRASGAPRGEQASPPEALHLALIRRATAELFADPADYGRTLGAVCRLLVPELADWCTVDLVCDDGTLACAAAHHADPIRQPIADELHRLPAPAGPFAPERVASGGASEWVASVEGDPELAAARDRPGRAAELVRALGISSYVAAPLLARGRRLGVLTMVCGDSCRSFGPGDAAFAEDLAALCALALDNARLFREVEEARRMAESVARAQSDAARFGEQLLGIVSHDLRSPIAAVQASAQLALRRSPEDEPLRRALRRAVSSAQRMGRMVDDLLDFTRARLGGGIPLRRREADLGKIARYAVEEAQAAHPEHPLEHRLHYEKGHYDPDRLGQVVQNLIVNALEHGAPRSPVVVSTRAEGNEMVLEVANQGPVIAPAALRSIFEPFQRGAHGKSRSLGLGLFIVREIVEAHGGEVEARSGPEGTAFAVRLPRRAPSR